MALRRGFDTFEFLSRTGEGRSLQTRRAGDTVFSQGDPADAVFYIRSGTLMLKVSNPQGKVAVIALLAPGDFFGENCLTAQKPRFSSAIVMRDCSLVRVEKWRMLRDLSQHPEFAKAFIGHLLARNGRSEEDLADQLFNSSERRLARVLLLLANNGKTGVPIAVIPRISQETLAEMVGTTRSRVSYFMNKFRRLGYVNYNGHLEINTSLLTVALTVGNDTFGDAA
jgi:CRP/FNR family cyclic AMP-dependent transcriptional regulator